MQRHPVCICGITTAAVARLLMLPDISFCYIFLTITNLSWMSGIYRNQTFEETRIKMIIKLYKMLMKIFSIWFE